MIWLTIILVIISAYLAVRLFMIKRSMHSMTVHFREARHNLEAEQHVHIDVPDRSMEELGTELNQYLCNYFETTSEYRTEIHQIRNEITNLSHDLRTPLTSILGYIDLLKEENPSKEQMEYMEVIKRRGENLNELINQLYEYARLQNQDYPMEIIPIDLYQLIQEHMLEYYGEFTKNGIDVTMELGEEHHPVMVMADRKCLTRILVNLTSNSMKYSGGLLKVSLEEGRETKVTYCTRRGNLSQYDIAHLFDRFYQKDINRPTTMGSGLGLTISKIFMERMGGSIKAQADEDYLYLICTFTSAQGEENNGKSDCLSIK